jgi:RHS repeat-associated protein
VFARINSSGTAAWYLTDYENSVVGLVDAGGTPQATIAYDGFGNVTSNSNGSFSDRYLYTGREFNATNGLQYNRGRYYDPSVGRWTQTDPLGMGGGDTNLYRYSNNSPANVVDPFGLTGHGVKNTTGDGRGSSGGGAGDGAGHGIKNTDGGGGGGGSGGQGGGGPDNGAGHGIMSTGGGGGAAARARGAIPGCWRPGRPFSHPSQSHRRRLGHRPFADPPHGGDDRLVRRRRRQR